MIKGTGVFPATRQSLVVTAVLWSMLLCGFAPGTLWAQDEPTEEEPIVNVPLAEEEVVDWQAPAWVMDPDTAEHFRRRVMNKLASALKNKNPSKADEEGFRKISQYYLSKLTHPANTDLPKDVVERFYNQVTNSFTMPAGRDIMLREVLDKAPELLKHPRAVTRYNTVLLLASLSTDKASINPKAPAKPFNESHDLLSEVMQNTSQLPECRILAARALGRILKDGDPSSNLRAEIGLKLTDTLASIPNDSSDETWWFRFRIAESLGYVGRLDNVSNPDNNVLDALLGLLRNPRERILIRCQAALSLSQLPLTSSTDVPAILYDINKLLFDMSGAYATALKKHQSNPSKNPMSPVWRMSFARIYLSYRPAGAKEASRNWGFLYKGVGKHASAITAAWEAAFPVLKEVVGSQSPAPIPAAAVASLETWVKANKPAQTAAKAQ